MTRVTVALRQGLVVEEGGGEAVGVVAVVGEASRVGETLSDEDEGEDANDRYGVWYVSRAVCSGEAETTYR